MNEQQLHNAIAQELGQMHLTIIAQRLQLAAARPAAAVKQEKPPAEDEDADHAIARELNK